MPRCIGHFSVPDPLPEASPELTRLRVPGYRTHSGLATKSGLVIPARTNALRVYGVPDDAERLDALCTALSRQSGFDVPYLEDTLACVAYRALAAMLRARRVFAPHAADVARRQNGLCAICQARATLEIHHVVLVAAGPSPSCCPG